MTLREYTKKMQKFEVEAAKLRRQVFRLLEKALESDMVPAHKYVTVTEPESEYSLEVFFHPRNYSIRFLPVRNEADLEVRVQILDVTRGATGTPVAPVTVGPFGEKAAEQVCTAFQQYLDAHWPG